ncbi:MAG: ATP-binding protein [Candidatus Saccharimonadales bacterium]
MNRWYVITGGPSTGKTTLLAELNRLGFSTVPEAARTVIDQAIERGQTVAELRADEQAFQDLVTKMKQSVEASQATDVVTFFDRGMHDTLAYLRHYGYPVEDWVRELMDRARYKKVFLLDSLPSYEQDYARTEDSVFSKGIQKLLHDAYAENGMKPITVPVLPTVERAQFVLSHL